MFERTENPANYGTAITDLRGIQTHVRGIKKKKTKHFANIKVAVTPSSLWCKVWMCRPWCSPQFQRQIYNSSQDQIHVFIQYQIVSHFL